jgi:glycosyltransferase involved in cell wall biosynthesis
MFTTIIPTYRRAHLLHRSIGSALAQTVPDVRVAVYDNASDDDTERVVRGLAQRDPRISYYRHADNIGGAANIAFAMRRIDTPFFSILCDDDVLLPRFYEIALREFAKFPAAMFAEASTLEISEAGAIVLASTAFRDHCGYFDARANLRRMVGGKHPTMTTVAFRREIVDAIGVVDPSAGALLDLDYFIRAAREHPCAITHDVAGLYVRHAGSWTNTNAALGRDFTTLIEKVEDLGWLAEALGKQRNFSLFHRSITCLADGDWQRTLDYSVQLRSYGARNGARIAWFLGTVGRFFPPLSWATRKSYALQLHVLGLRCIALLRAMGVAGAENGFRDELAYFRTATVPH